MISASLSHRLKHWRLHYSRKPIRAWFSLIYVEKYFFRMHINRPRRQTLHSIFTKYIHIRIINFKWITLHKCLAKHKKSNENYSSLKKKKEEWNKREENKLIYYYLQTNRNKKLCSSSLTSTNGIKCYRSNEFYGIETVAALNHHNDIIV